MQDAVVEAQALKKTGLSEWVASHDDSFVFTVLYVGLAVVLSIFISLFWLIAVVVLHGALEWYALRNRGLCDSRMSLVLWHIKLDIGLVLFALWLGIYMDIIFGVAGLGALVRVGTQAAARALSWQQVFRGLLLTMDDLAQIARAVARRKAGRKSGPDPAEMMTSVRAGRETWSGGDWISVSLIVVFTALILTAPLFTEHTWATVFQTMAQDLHPWP